jgi:hypothetical protein
MARISQIRSRRIRRRFAANSSVRQMRAVVAIISACPARHGASESLVHSDCVRAVKAHGFLLACGTNRHPRSTHRGKHSGGLILWLSSRSSQAPLWAFPSPCGRLALLLLRLPEKSSRKEHREHFSKPSVNAELRHLGAGLCARLRPVCPEQIRSSNTEEIIMYRIAFHLSDSQARTPRPVPPTTRSHTPCYQSQRSPRTRTRVPANTSTAPNDTA